MMQARYQSAVLGFVALLAAASFDANGQSLETLRAAREQAKADLARAQEAFDRADEAYIKALGGAASKAAVASTPSPAPVAASTPTATAAPSSAESRPISEVTFSLSGTGAIEVSPFAYRARLIVDGRPAEWTKHASGVKVPVPAGTQSLAYEVQNDSKNDSVSPLWKTVCQGNLPLKPKTTVEIAIGQGITCATL